jgi:quinol monooxygenase YgiN
MRGPSVKRVSAAAVIESKFTHGDIYGDVDVSKLAIIGSLEIAAGYLDRVLPLVMAHRTRCLASEPGTLQFEVLLPHDEQARVLLYEVYTDDAAFVAHWNGPSVKQLREESAGMILKVSGTRCGLVE